MPYGISDTAWAQMTYADQQHAQARVENARAGTGQYGSVENAKAANAAQWGSAGSSSIRQPYSPFLSGVGGAISDVGAAVGAAAGAFSGGGEPPNYGDGSNSGDDSYGSAGAIPAAPPRPSLASSPEWLAYLNALGLEQGQFEADIARQRGVYAADATRQIGDLGPIHDLQRRGITGSLEARGAVRSGEFLRRLADNRAAQGRETGAIQGGLALKQSDLESQLAQKMIDINARKAAQELQLRAQGYTS